MKQIGTTLANSGSPASRPGSGRVVSVRTLGVQPPKIFNQSTDVDIPRSAWSGWVPSDGSKRALRRPLTEDERKALTVRRDELAAFVGPFDRTETDQVVTAIAEMLSGYRSMRQTGSDMLAMVDSLARALAPYPAWAIDYELRSIRSNGVWRDGKFDRQWPPNDAEVIDAVRKRTNVYADQHRSACALLEAEVEEE